MNRDSNPETTAQDSMKSDRGSTVPPNPDSFHLPSANPQAHMALWPPSSNDAQPTTNQSNLPQPHRHSHTHTMDSNATPLTESNLGEHCRQVSLLVEDPDYAARIEQEYRDNMVAALHTLGHGDLPAWVIGDMTKRG